MGKTALRQYLDLAGITYREAARRTGLTHQSVFMHARGKSPIGAASALIYYRVFGISLEKLLADRKLPGPNDRTFRMLGCLRTMKTKLWFRITTKIRS